MTDLTIAELARLRRRIGDNGSPPAFPDPELQDNWADSGQNWNSCVLLCIDDLLADSFRFNDYTQNQSTERKQQVFQNLLNLQKVWQAKVDHDIAVGKAAKQVVMMGVRRVPPTHFDEPADAPGDIDDLEAPPHLSGTN